MNVSQNSLEVGTFTVGTTLVMTGMVGMTVSSHPSFVAFLGVGSLLVMCLGLFTN